MHGMRGSKAGTSEDIAGWTWFGGVRLGRDHGTVFGTVIMKNKSSGRRLASGRDTQEHTTAVQVARDAIALLLKRLPAAFPSSPTSPVHVVTLAILHQCLASLAPLSVVEPTQPTVLIPVHLCAASLAHREHFGADVSTAVGYCTARMACALMGGEKATTCRRPCGGVCAAPPSRP